MADDHVNTGVEVVFLPSEDRRPLDHADEAKIRNLVKKHLLLSSDIPYHRAQVEVERDATGRPVALLATLLRAKTYTADIVRIQLDSALGVTSTERLS